MRLLDRLTIHYRNEPRHIEIYQGDLTAIPPGEEVDLLLVSAFPNDYEPTERSIIGALDRCGLSVAKLAEKKTLDLREAASCWLSTELTESDSQRYGFRRLICFEPDEFSEPPQQVGDIFRALGQFVSVGESRPYSVAMPTVATGDAGYPLVDILEPLLNAAVRWLLLGLPLERLKIVAHSPERALELQGAFSMFKKMYQRNPPTPLSYRFDVFLSYSNHNSAAICQFYHRLRELDNTVKVFLDKQELDIGSAWHEELYQAVFGSRLMAVFYSPTYLISQVCLEEFNLARMHHQQSGSQVLFPIYLHDVPLPPSMAAIQFIDCREADPDRLDNACRKLLERIRITRNQTVNTMLSDVGTP